MRPRIAELCAGYTGLGMAIGEVLGGELALVADNDPGASAILAHRFPSVPNYTDITTADWMAAGPADILAAGFPCQPVSLAGKQLGEADERWIWPSVVRAVRDLRPGLVVLENVSALVVRGLAGVAADLAQIGYVGSWCCLRASDVGACHRRERVFILAWPAEDADRAAGGQRRFAAPGQAAGGRTRADAGRPSGASAIADAAMRGRDDRVQHAVEPGPAGAGLSAARDAGGGDLAPADTASDGRDERRPEPAGIIGGPDAAVSSDEPLCPSCGCPEGVHDSGGFCAGRCGGNCADAELGRPDGPWNSFEDDADPADVRAYALAHSAGIRHGDAREAGERGIPAAAVPGTPADADRDGLARGAERHGEPQRGQAGHEQRRVDPLRRVLDWGNYAPAIHRWEAVLGRPAPRPTEPGRTGERLSPRFVEWMMGLPEGWVTDVPGLSRNAQLKALGNGVVPQQAAMALRLLLERSGLLPLVAADLTSAEGGEAA